MIDPTNLALVGAAFACSGIGIGGIVAAIVARAGKRTAEEAYANIHAQREADMIGAARVRRQLDRDFDEIGRLRAEVHRLKSKIQPRDARGHFVSTKETATTGA